MMRRTLALGLLLLITRAGFAAEPEAPKTLDELKQRIEKAVTDYKVPAIGIALVNRDGPVWVAGWGKADVKSGRAADPDTLFRIGSVSKMFAALAVLKLVEEGKLSLDDKVRDRAPDVAFENPWEATHPVRIVHLLEHTTGWDDAHIAEYAYAAPDTMTIKQGLDYHPDPRTSRWPPGARHAYNNIGPAVAAYVVEKVTGQRFEDYIANEFFTPLGMTSTSYFRTKLYDERGATLYQGLEPQAYWQIIHRPAGSINSSARDMARFLQFLLMRGSTANGPIVSEASFLRMETPGTLPGNAMGVLAGYGLYNYTSGYRAQGVAFHGHNGGMMGGLTELAYERKSGQGYVFMINSDNGAALGQISDLLKGYLLRDTQWPNVQAAPLPEKYRHIDGWYQNITPRSDNMLLTTSLLSFLKVTHDGKHLHRSPLFAPWISDDYTGPRDVLVDRWSGLPTIAVVDDPLAGPALQIASDLYVRVATWKMFARFAVPLLMIVMTIAGFVALIVWAVRRRKKATTDTRLWMRLWPLIASVVLISFLIISVMSGMFLQLMATVSVLSVGLMLLSIAYPAAALAGAACLFSAKGRERKNLDYWFAAAFVAVHLLIAGYLAMFGTIGIRTWA
jgi:CubicO group peptidase (beta-lactamase class C family)/cbb3-type cytochrome oxidase subunit 3